MSKESAMQLCFKVMYFILRCLRLHVVNTVMTSGALYTQMGEKSFSLLKYVMVLVYPGVCLFLWLTCCDSFKIGPASV